MSDRFCAACHAPLERRAAAADGDDAAFAWLKFCDLTCSFFRGGICSVPCGCAKCNDLLALLADPDTTPDYVFTVADLGDGPDIYSIVAFPGWLAIWRAGAK